MDYENLGECHDVGDSNVDEAGKKMYCLSDNDILSDDNEWMMKREAFIGEYQHISV